MKKYKYSDLLLDERGIKDLYSKFGINYIDSNRISEYFKYLRKIESLRKSDKSRLRELINNEKAKYYFSQFYVLETCNIINAVKSANVNKDILKEKLTNLVKGTYLLSEENINNTQARNTTFELSLFSFLNTRKLEVKLCSPNPDLQLFTDNFTYNIECKRPSSIKSLEKNIRKALKQLRKTKKGNIIPTMALSLEQAILGDDLILNTKDDKTALLYLNEMMSRFNKDHQYLINKICNDEPCLILYYLSCLTGFMTDLPMANTTYIIGNVYNFEPKLSHKIYCDLNTILPQNEN